jgi:hypothetical protein
LGAAAIDEELATINVAAVFRSEKDRGTSDVASGTTTS